VRLGLDQTLAGEDAPDGAYRWRPVDQGQEVVGDGAGAGVETGRDQARAEAKDGGLGLGIDLVRAGSRSS
jgi:hypothetical protein